MNATEEDTALKLVREVEKYPVLYNSSLPDYSRRDVVEAAWENVARQMDDSALNCKFKWRTLRTGYVRKLKTSQIDSPRQKPYYLMDAMEYLRPFIKPTPVKILYRLRDDAVIDPPPPAPPEQGAPDPTVVNCKLETLSDGEAEYAEYILGHTPDSTFGEGCSGDVTAPSPLEEAPSEFNNPRDSKRDCPVEEDTMPSLMSSKRRKELQDNYREMFLLSLLPEMHKLSESQMRVFRHKVLESLDEALAWPDT